MDTYFQDVLFPCEEFEIDLNVEPDEKVIEAIPVYKCKICPKTFSQERPREMHELSHVESTLYICSICNKIFPTLINLNNHNIIHRKEPVKFKCEYCPMQFNKENSCILHTKVCKKVFDDDFSKDLTFKQGKKKPYSCHYCGRGYIYDMRRKKHELTCNL